MRLTSADGRWELLRGTLAMKSSAVGYIMAKRKYLTNEFVEAMGINVPPMVVYSDKPAAREFLELYKTVVVKPADAMQSHGVATNVTTIEQLTAAVTEAKRHTQTGEVVLQKQLEGKLYRLFMLEDKMVAAAYRKAAEVVGDGRSTVEQLLAELNRDPRRSDGSHTPLKRVSRVTAETYLGPERFTSVPERGEVVRVSPLDSISAGGEAANVTDLVHPELAKLAERVAGELQLFACGLDIMCEDVADEPPADFLPILEVNSMPGLKLHHYPTAGGEPIDVAGMMIDRLFPEKSAT